MFPFNFEWIWDAGHLLFMGGLWFALSIMGLGVTYCIIKAIFDMSKKSGAVIIRRREPSCIKGAYSGNAPGEALFLLIVQGFEVHGHKR